MDTFKNRVNNFLDHSNLGESNMYFPIAVDGALVRAWEMTLHSPAALALWAVLCDVLEPDRRAARQHYWRIHMQHRDRSGLRSGDFDYSPVDHDQRDTLNTGFTANLPAHTWFATNVYYGSGFTNGLAGDRAKGRTTEPYLPAHTTFDSSIGHSFGENWQISATAINVTNHRVLLDNSITIGGFHWNDPRMLQVEARYRFNFWASGRSACRC